MKTLPLFLLILISFNFSCLNKNRLRCHEAPSEGITVKFEFPGVSNYKAVKYWDFDSIKMCDVCLNEKDFYNIMHGIKVADLPNNLYMAVMYLDADPGASSVISPANIMSFSTYSIEGTTMYHKLFMPKEPSGIYNSVEEYSCSVSGIHTADMHSIATGLRKSNQKQVTWMILYPDNISQVEIKSEPQLTKILKKRALHLAANNK